jgi:hypothetical protein
MLPVNDLHLGKPWHLVVIEPGMRKRGTPTAVERLSIGKINCAFYCNVAVGDHVEQLPLFRREHPWHIFQWGGQLAVA